MQSVQEKHETKELTLTDISQLGRIERTKEILKGVNVTLQTLTQAHQQQVLSTVPQQTDSKDALTKFLYIQIETLVHATVSINGKKYTGNDETELRTFYTNLQGKILQAFYSFYSDLVEEQNSVIDSLKKT